MKKKVLKEQQQETREIVKQIFNLALAVNPNNTTQDKTGEKPTVFVNFSGHVAGVDVRIYRNGWAPDFAGVDDEMITYTIWLDDEQFTILADDYEPYPEEECDQLTKAKAALAELKRIAEEWGADYV